MIDLKVVVPANWHALLLRGSGISVSSYSPIKEAKITLSRKPPVRAVNCNHWQAYWSWKGQVERRAFRVFSFKEVIEWIVGILPDSLEGIECLHGLRKEHRNGIAFNNTKVFIEKTLESKFVYPHRRYCQVEAIVPCWQDIRYISVLVFIRHALTTAKT